MVCSIQYALCSIHFSCIWETICEKTGCFWNSVRRYYNHLTSPLKRWNGDKPLSIDFIVVNLKVPKHFDTPLKRCSKQSYDFEVKPLYNKNSQKLIRFWEFLLFGANYLTLPVIRDSSAALFLNNAIFEGFFIFCVLVRGDSRDIQFPLFTTLFTYTGWFLPFDFWIAAMSGSFPMISNRVNFILHGIIFYKMLAMHTYLVIFPFHK